MVFGKTERTVEVSLIAFKTVSGEAAMVVLARMEKDP